MCSTNEDVTPVVTDFFQQCDVSHANFKRSLHRQNTVIRCELSIMGTECKQALKNGIVFFALLAKYKFNRIIVDGWRNMYGELHKQHSSC